ncbi:unnamed protein product, partial [Mesorhabditis belari]|uniref:Uncharacterized protein n=1 Tax=Mesorhabditis belari TaxID=2138241 RepID=A0AAF3FPC9_9BILA
MSLNRLSIIFCLSFLLIIASLDKIDAAIQVVPQCSKECQREDGDVKGKHIDACCQSNGYRRGCLCMKQNWYHQVPSKNLKWIINGNSPALIVVRDPIERFVSMYAYLCK